MNGRCERGGITKTNTCSPCVLRSGAVRYRPVPRVHLRGPPLPPVRALRCDGRGPRARVGRSGRTSQLIMTAGAGDV